MDYGNLIYIMYKSEIPLTDDNYIWEIAKRTYLKLRIEFTFML